MKLKNKILTSLLTAVVLYSSHAYSTTIKNLDLQRKQLTTPTNIVVAASVATLQVGDYIQMSSSDNKNFTGRVTKIEESPEFVKIYGSIFEHKDTMFGFMMQKGGEFQGCITDENQTIWYVMELDLNVKGYVFYKKIKFNKTI